MEKNRESTLTIEYCWYGKNACCLECQIKDQCNIQCGDIDSYEYAVECPYYVKENEEKNEKV